MANFETDRNQFYENEIVSMSGQIAELLEKGYAVEIARSRSGLKLFAIKRKHEVVKKVQTERKVKVIESPL